MARKAVDTLKAKQKKQKIVAAVLGVVFVGLLAFQAPRVWKQLHPPAPAQSASSSSSSTTTTTAGTPSLAAPTLSSGSQAPTAIPASSTGTAAPVVADGQLSSFSLFASKDPFAQQLSDESDGSSTSSSSGGSKAGSGSGSGGSGTSSGGSASAPNPGTAVISVNGTLYTVAVGTDFPEASSTDPSVVPLFHLISATAHTAKISIVGGSYASGAPAVTLQENKPVTLMNTADGTRYKLILKPLGTATPAAAAPTSTTSTTSTTVTVPPPSSP